MSQSIATTRPHVTVVVPAYNAAATLPATVTSVCAQTFTDWELIVVDDGSSDATVSIVEQMAAADRRVRLVTQRNQGPSAARNNGIDSGAGEIIAFLDADDSWAADHLERAIDLLANDDRLGVAFAPCVIVDADDRVTGQTRPSLDNVTAAEILAGNPTATCSSLVVRRSVFADAGLFREDMVHAEDQEWLFRAVLSGWQCRSHATCSVRYRCNPNGLSSDVQRMYAGWQTFVAIAQATAPRVTACHLPAATASMHLYYVRRLMRDRRVSWDLVHHFAGAWLAAPSTAAGLSARLLASVLKSACAGAARSVSRGLSTIGRADWIAVHRVV